MRLDEFNYMLPDGLIAQRPAEPRDSSRMLLLDRATGKIVWRREILADRAEHLHELADL